MGALYDGEKRSGANACYGNHCFQISFIIFFALTGISVVMDALLFQRHLTKYRTHWKQVKRASKYDSYLLHDA